MGFFAFTNLNTHADGFYIKFNNKDKPILKNMMYKQTERFCCTHNRGFFKIKSFKAVSDDGGKEVVVESGIINEYNTAYHYHYDYDFNRMKDQQHKIVFMRNLTYIPNLYSKPDNETVSYGFFATNESCRDPCLNCHDKDKCLGCIPKNFMHNKLCYPCLQGCEKCDNVENCEKCEFGYVMKKLSKVKNICVKCHSSCGSCSSLTQIY